LNAPPPTSLHTLSLHDALPIYAQDQSTFGRLTLQGAVRYDGASGQFLDQQILPERWIPNGLSLPAQDGVKGYRDLTPRLGASYEDRKSTRLNSSHVSISYAVFC